MSLTLNLPKEKGFSKYILPATFDNFTVSNNVTFTYIQAFKEKIGFNKILSSILSFKKAPNAVFQPAEIIDFMIDSVIQGNTRFLHMEQLRYDNAYTEIKGHKVPSEKVCRDLIKAMPESSLEELRLINKTLLSLQSKGTKREVIMNFDDTVCTIFGEQEGASVGYNPRYHGRPSFKEKIGIIANTDELVNVTLEEGKHHTNHGFLDFVKSCEEQLPENWIIKRVRVDRGAFDYDNILYFESKGYEYVMKAKNQAWIRCFIDYVNQREHLYPWTEIDKTFSVNEIYAKMPKWDKVRRTVIIRKKLLQPKTGQICMDIDEFKYEYQAIVTNIEYMTPEEIFHEYNQRCDIENKIDELKEGFAFSKNSQRNKFCNEIFLLIKMIAYNLHNWFKRTILPEFMSHHEITTIRRILYNVPGNLVGKGRYRHIRYPNNPFLKTVITYIRKALMVFCLT
ncbi:IS1380-like element ISTps2 family transposase [Thermoanaerobacter indiensis]|uniref:IS1380-like element ISTps2 family transposase n=1 Tax=Thermoanaerobacter indiensis TaxID=1125974 RepID=UPI00037D7874|nr:IS1380-like element ISTps2 family transposase [Thermoanaerobacter indiensis]